MPFKNVIKHFSELDKSEGGNTESDKTTAHAAEKILRGGI
jgi:hypothetical protein